MDDWYDIGALLVCRTCQDREICGHLIAYDLDKKFILLNKGKSSTIDDWENKGESNCSEKYNYELINLKYVAEITEVSKDNALTVLNNDTNLTNNSNTSINASMDVDASMDASMNSVNTSIHNSINNSSPTPIESISNHNPPVHIDIDKIQQKLAIKKKEIIKNAKLANLGVTKQGLEIYTEIKKTLGANVKWDSKKGNIIVFSEVQIQNPFTVASTSLINEKEGNKHSLGHVIKIMEKYYTKQSSTSQKKSQTVKTS